MLASLVALKGVRIAGLRLKAGLKVPPAPVAHNLTMLPGKVAVAVHITNEPEHGELWTDEDDGNRGRTDIATVIASGREGVEPGDVVVLLPLWGKYIHWFRSSGTIYGEVRMLGDAGKKGVSELYDPVKAMPFKVEMENKRLKPIGGRVLVKRDPQITHYGSLVLPSTVGDRSGESEVLEVCESVTKVKVGNRVVCHAGSYVPIPIPKEFADSYGCEPDDLAFIHEDSIYCVL